MKLFIQKFGITVYMLVLMLHLFAQLLGYTSIQYGSKLILLPLLMLYFYVQPFFAAAPNTKYLILVGLFGSFLGDAFLLSDALFIPGMIAFMTTHIFNILFFHPLTPTKGASKGKLYIAIVLLAAFCAFVYLFLKDAMGALIYPILVYMLLISTSAIYTVRASLNSKATTIADLFWTPGMLFFIASDAVLAFNKFYWAAQSPIDNIGLVTMATYGIAQLLLVKGFQLYFSK
jgi:YhhN family